MLLTKSLEFLDLHYYVRSHYRNHQKDNIMDPTLIALYEIKRQSFLLGFLQNPDNFDPALAYAYNNRVAPYFHENSAKEHYECDPFDEIYFVKRAFLDEVYGYIDECELAGEHTNLEFNKLEDKFGGYRTNRIELIYALEYARINGRFTSECWKSIESKAPAEANSIESTFSASDIHFG